MDTNEFRQLRKELKNALSISRIMPSDLLLMPSALHDVLNQTFREGQIKTSQIADALKLTPRQAKAIIDYLVEKEILQKADSGKRSVFTARFGGRTKREGSSLLDKI